jgi:hypothetical protein
MSRFWACASNRMPSAIPDVTVALAPLALYDELTVVAAPSPTVDMTLDIATEPPLEVKLEVTPQGNPDVMLATATLLRDGGVA